MNAQQHARPGLIVQKSCQATGVAGTKLVAFSQRVRSKIDDTVEGTICVVKPTRRRTMSYRCGSHSLNAGASSLRALKRWSGEFRSGNGGYFGEGRACQLARRLTARAAGEGAMKAPRGVGVDSGRHALVHDRVRHRMDTYLRRIRHLLDADYKVHGVSPGSNHMCASVSVAGKR